MNAGDKDDYTVLYYATRAELLEIIKQLVEKKAEVNACDKDGRTVLHYAVEANVRLEIIK